MNKVKMKVNPRIIEHLGSDLITSAAVAVVELIKNSIDAHSKRVNVQFFDGIEYLKKNDKMLVPLDDNMFFLLNEKGSASDMLLIEDIGIGMNAVQLREGFLNIGTDIKYKDYENTNLGEKGIGRLAAQCLGKKLILETASSDDEQRKVIFIDWNALINSDKIDEFEIPYYELPKMAEAYTRMWIIDVKKDELINEPLQLGLFDNNKVTLSDDLRVATSFLISPYDKKVRNIEIAFYNNGMRIESGFDLELLNFAESVNVFEINNINGKIELDMSLNLTPQFIEKTHRSCIKPVSYFPKYRREKEEYIHFFERYRERYEVSLNITISHEELVNKIKEKRKKEYSDIKNQAALEEFLVKQVEKELTELMAILPIEGRAYNFKQDNAIGKIYVDYVKYLKSGTNPDIEKYSLDDIQKFLSLYNGIKLYRNGYRIGALGNRDDDWIEMQQYRTSGQQFYRMNQSNTVGYVSINDPMQTNIREISSRLDVVQNDVAKIFKEVIITIFNYYFYDFNRVADDITKSVLRDEGLLQDDTKKEVKRRKNENSKLLKENQRLLKEIKKTKEILLSKAVVIGDEVNISQKVYDKAIETLNSVDTQIQITQEELGKTREVLDTAEAGLKEIQIEAFNNYKLMANGLITETMTHELHSIVNDPNMYNIEGDFEVLKEFLYDTNIKLYNDNLLPIKDQSDLLLGKVEDIADLYNFLEKTFIKKNNYDEYACESVGDVVGEIERKLKKELSKNKITIRQENLKTLWYMPKGVLLHVLYNLFTNSIYWIDIREKRALKEKNYYVPNNEIVVEQKTDTNIWVYDSGLGVLKKMEYILFEALQSGKENDGRGMGLYIVKKLLKSFNADIELLEKTNEWGNRYIFSITAPKDCVR
jgi:signal transduction histidine kinase